METCACGSKKDFSQCCAPLLSGEKNADSPEQLMRSRYTAYVKANIPYLRDTLLPESRPSFNAAEAEAWAKEAEWLGLEIVRAEGDRVEFLAKYRAQGKTLEHHEVSKFRMRGGKWYFVDGEMHVHEEGKGHEHHHPTQQPIRRDESKVGRNDPCTCGSGKKFKKCCGTAA